MPTAQAVPSSRMTEIRLEVAGYEDSDAEERAKLTASLRDELRAIDVEDVSHPAADPQSGAKGTAFEWAQLVVTLGGSLPAVIGALRAWLGRHEGASVTLEINGDRLTLSNPSAREREELIAAWMARHAG